MNQLGHRIVAWLGKAALKTHALQTLRDCLASPNRAKRLECVRFIGAFRRARDGSRFVVVMHAQKRKDAFREPTVRSPGFSRSEPPEGGTPNKGRPHGAVHGPNASEKRKEALHERGSRRVTATAAFYGPYASLSIVFQLFYKFLTNDDALVHKMGL